DSDSEVESDRSRDDLVKLLAEKEELLNLKQKDMEKMQDKVLRTYAEMENVMERTKREAENSKKFAIQVSLTCFFTELWIRYSYGDCCLFENLAPCEFLQKCVTELCKESTGRCRQFGKSFISCQGQFFKNRCV